MKTYNPTAEEAKASREWWVVDVTGCTLGRVASEISQILRGKHKPTFSPHVDAGDFVIITNCERIVVTGNKLDDKYYHRHSLYPGGLTSRNLRDQLERFPERVIYDAVKGMMPKTKLARAQMKKLRVYVGREHPHQAQEPKPLEL